MGIKNLHSQQRRSAACTRPLFHLPYALAAESQCASESLVCPDPIRLGVRGGSRVVGFLRRILLRIIEAESPADQPGFEGRQSIQCLMQLVEFLRRLDLLIVIIPVDDGFLEIGPFIIIVARRRRDHLVIRDLRSAPASGGL